MNSVISAGTSVIASSEEALAAKVLVSASGRKSRPSWPSSRNTGVKETMTMMSEKKIGRPTCCAAWMTVRTGWAFSSGLPSDSRR